MDNYIIHRIPKRSAGKVTGVRILEEPIPELKKLQKQLIPDIIKEFSFPSYLNGIGGTNTFSNSSPHVGKPVVYKIDLKDYFHTITSDKLKRSIKNEQLLNIILDKCLFNNRLPTGAPTSPILAIIAFLDIDKEIINLIGDKDISYTRYMDDLTFSTNSLNVLNFSFIKAIQEKIKSAGFLINYKKSGLSLKWERQLVTGIVVNQKINIPTEKRLLLRAKIDHIARNKSELTDEIKGELSYIRSINLDLYNKYLVYFEKRKGRYSMIMEPETGGAR